MARSMAIPARINGVTGKVQLIGDDGAMDVDLNHHPEEPVFMAEGIASKGSWWLPISLSVRWITRNTILISLFPNRPRRQFAIAFL